MDEDFSAHKSSLCLAGVYAFIMYIGYWAENDFAMLMPFWTLFSWVACFCVLLRVMFFRALTYQCATQRTEGITVLRKKVKTYHIFMFILVCWVPYFLIYCPGILSYDSINQVSQLLGVIPLNNDHPTFHTLLIGLFLFLGKLVGGNQQGVIFFIMFQMIVMAAIYTYAISFLLQMKVHRYLVICILFYFALSPINAIYSITMWKDVLYGGVFLLFIIALFRLVCDVEAFFASKWAMAKVMTIGFLVCMLRNNGIIVIALFSPALIIFAKKYWRQTLAGCISLIVVYGLITGPVFNAFGLKKNAGLDALAIPFQQVARTVCEYKDVLTKSELSEINRFMPIEEISDTYTGFLFDPIKKIVNVQAFKQDTTKFVKLWISLGIAYPKAYIRSFVANSYGYYYPDTFRPPYALGVYENQFGIFQTPILGREIERDASSRIYSFIASLPVTTFFSDIGLFMWIGGFAASLLIVKNNKKYVIPFIPSFIIWLSMLASPLNTEYRYVFPIMICVPIYLSIALVIPKVKKEKS